MNNIAIFTPITVLRYSLGKGICSWDWLLQFCMPRALFLLR